MPANTQPIFPLTPKIDWEKVTTGNTAMDGTGTVGNLFSAGVNGAKIDEIKCKSLGTNVKTVLRIFINNGSVTTTAINNTLYAEVDLPATTANDSNAITTELIVLEPLTNLVLSPSYKLYVCVGTTVAAGWQITAIGNDY
jgi:hypothetical protein